MIQRWDRISKPKSKTSDRSVYRIYAVSMFGMFGSACQHRAVRIDTPMRGSSLVQECGLDRHVFSSVCMYIHSTEHVDC